MHERDKDQMDNTLVLLNFIKVLFNLIKNSFLMREKGILYQSVIKVVRKFALLKEK